MLAETEYSKGTFSVILAASPPCLNVILPDMFLRSNRILCGCLVAAGLAWLCASAVAAEERTGAVIFRELCASCHGPNGEGVKEEYGKPLAGDKSVEELAKLIAKTMPEDNPGKCVGEDARKVAAYIYDAFYSPIAQARNQPARIDLARLTVRQYKHTVADLVTKSRAQKWDDRRGLNGEYFQARQFNPKERKLERLDPTVKFDFGEDSPVPGEIEPAEFAMRWKGSIWAPETGEYEFIVETQNGTQLWVNDQAKPLIDGSVRSGKDVELRESVWLLGGRSYPIRLQVFKSKQAKEKSARIVLKWAIPHRAAEVVADRYLSPLNSPQTLVVQTRFPPDDRSLGYERGTSISQAWDQAVTDAAIEAADYVSANLPEASNVPRTGADRPAKIRAFADQFVSRAFRRPVSGDFQRDFIERQFQEQSDPEVALNRVVLMTLLAPQFLYLELEPPLPTDPSDDFDVASRLSYGLWDSLPDDELARAATAHKLSTLDQVRQQARRMVDDARTRGKLHDFLSQWLRLDRFEELSKDSKRFPDFDQAIVSDLHTALDLFLDEVVWSEASDFRQLLLADSLYMNGRLSTFYGAELAPDSPFEKVSLQADERAGVLTHPYLMAGYAYTSTSSPIHRGVFVARSVLGRALRPPPEAVAPLAPDLHADLTTRERVVLQTKAQSCQSCHRMINPLGFAFEHFDAVGRFREEEKGRPIDATGSYQTRTGEMIKFADVRELANYLASSSETHEAFIEQLFQYLVKQPVLAYGPDTLSKLQKQFAQDQCSIRKLMVEIMAMTAPEGRN